MPDLALPDLAPKNFAPKGLAPTGLAPTDFAARRTVMVDSQVRPADVTKFPIIEAMLHVPREDFVPPGRQEAAYMGENLHVGPGRVVLEPRTLAKLLEGLDVRPTDRALDLGAGYGYGAAVLGRLAGSVVALEDDRGRAEAARAALGRLGADNVVVVEGPLADGPPPALGPFDVILVEGAVEEVPRAVMASLAPGGRIGALFAEGALGTARIGREVDGQVHWRWAFNAGAPVLPGFAHAQAFAL